MAAIIILFGMFALTALISSLIGASIGMTIIIFIIVDFAVLALSMRVLNSPQGRKDIEAAGGIDNLMYNVKEYHGFDWDAYWKDIENGMDIMEQIKKKERGDYWITTPQHRK